MQITKGRKAYLSVALTLVALVVSACSNVPVSRAPVEDRGAQSAPLGTATAATVDSATLPGAENAGKPGYYTVRQGDTVMRIAAQVNQSWHDIAAWNNLADPNVIEVGQVLRVVPPAGAAPTYAAPVAVATQTTSTATPTPAAPEPPPAKPPSAGKDDVAFIWPAKGPILTKFDEVKSKGIAIGGNAGDPVLAAADGRVVYAGSGLRGYGNLVILKHNNTFLTAYAHNQKLLVKEDQNVKQGQKIAEMGSTDTNRVKLHFEIRRSNKPVNPLNYLPSK